MGKILISSAFAAGLIFSGCGSDSVDEIVDEVTSKSSVAFADLLNHTIKVRERHVHDADTNVIVFCAAGKVASGSHKDGTYDATAPTVTMTFTDTNSTTTETLTEEDTDATFKHDEHVKFNGQDYIITSIHEAPFAVCD